MSLLDKIFGRLNIVLSVLSFLAFIGVVVLIAILWCSPEQGRAEGIAFVFALMYLFVLSGMSASFLLIGTAFLKGWRIRWVLQASFITAFVYWMFY